MILDQMTVDPVRFARQTGWSIKPQGACKGDACVPLPAGQLDARVLSERLGMALVEDRGIIALGPEVVTGRALTTAQAPDLVLPDIHGTPIALSSLRGQKVVLVTWASWCGCRLDLAMWQALRAELHPKGLEVVTVALDSGGPDAVRPWLDIAKPEHPSLIDVGHTVDALLGVVNVPNCLWIDEQGVIVRPAEPGWPGRTPQIELMEKDVSELSVDHAEVAAEVRKMNIDPDRYPRMLRDWVAKGADSVFVMTPDEVIEHSLPRGADESRDAAGDVAGAVEHWRQAHALQPANWTYKRQAWNLAESNSVRNVTGYDSGWLADVRTLGAETYYPAPTR
jgi:peroxiredoxin